MARSFVAELKTSRCARVIETDAGKCIGILEPVADEHAADPKLVERICDWHNQSIEFYTDRAMWNPLATTEWLRTSMIASDRRILFLIRNSCDERIGLCGLSDIGAEQAEVYDIIRGEPGGHPLLLPYAEIAMLRLCFFGLGLKRVVGAVHTSNATARRMGQFVGFEDYECAKASPTNDVDERSRILLRITREQLLDRHPNLNGLPEMRDSKLAASAAG